VIVRVLGEGQYVIDEAHAELLNSLDSGLERAVEAGDEAGFRAVLTDLLAKVRTVGDPLPDDALAPSDAVLPDESSTLEEVRALLADSTEGLIPG
jgi:hypothetical protein